MAAQRTFVIAEAACTWRYSGLDVSNACQSIKIAKDCGADAWKTQWTSDGYAMAKRRGNDNGKAYSERLCYNKHWLNKFKDMCDQAGIEFMCTVFLPEDVEAIEPLVKRFKVSAYEHDDSELMEAIGDTGKVAIVSGRTPEVGVTMYCVSEYPCPLERLELCSVRWFTGLSDHSTSLITGAMAVAHQVNAIEKHFKLDGTPREDADYWHSLTPVQLKQYVANIREAEIAL